MHPSPPWTKSFFLILLWTPGLFCNFNLFVTRTEVKRLLGLNAEMFYVREGVVNDYAMSWTVKVAPSIHSIYFHWQGLTKRRVLYNMEVWTNKSSLLQGSPSPILDPTLNVSSAGVLPKKVGVFQVNMPCTGLVSGEVEVILNLNVTSPKANQKPVSLYFSRKKICLKGVAAESFLPRKDFEEVKNNDVKEEDPVPVFAVIISAVAGVVIVLGLVLAGICWRKKNFARKNKCSFSSTHPPLFITTNPMQIKTCADTPPKVSPFCQFESTYIGPSGGTYTVPSMDTGDSYASVYKFPFQSNELLSKTNNTLPKFSDSTTNSGNYESSCYSIFDYKSNTNNSSNNSKNQSFGSYIGIKEVRESDLVGQSLRLKRNMNFDRPNSSVNHFEISTLRDQFKHLQMERERVRLTEVVQEGTIGRIYRGWLQRETPELDQQVWVKTVKEGSSASEVENLCKEGTLIFNLRHQNLMSLVGMSFAPKSPPFLIFPDPGGINLKVYLESCGPFKVLDLVEIYLEAARGLHFMHANNIIHKDIASRNCIISENLQLRLTDSSLARDFFPEDYEGGDQNKPLRWMAPEAFQNNFTTQSDMWSLGILLWEMVNPLERPYESVHYKQILEFLEEGLRLNQPFACPDELYELMMACWNFSSDRRPSAFKASEFLTSFKQSLQSFI